MADALESARLKLKRANLHAGTLKRETRRFLNAYEKPTFRGQFEANFTRYVIYVKTGYPDPPDSFSVIFGDALHNYRSALDHLAWQLVKHGNQPRPNNPWLVQFPIYDLKRLFQKNVGRRLPGVDRDALEYIKSRNAQPRWNSRNNVLRHLANWTNDDKHRNIQLITSGLHQITLTSWTRDCVNLGVVHTVKRAPEYKEGAKVSELAIRRTGPNPKVHMAPAEVWSTVSLARSSMIAVWVLDEIRTEVESILKAPEIAAALA
jgi:hypothetical protein